MLLPTNDGVRCDRCGGTEKQDFTYYSYDFRELTVTNTVLPKLNFRQPATFSLDICPRCMNEIGELVKTNYKPFKMTQDRRCPQGIYCDLTKTKITNGIIYHCHIIKIDVHTSGMSITCDKCATPAKNSDQPCSKCGHNSFSRSASTNIEDRWLELLLDEKTYEQFKQRAINLRSSEAAQWSASSE